MILSFRKNSFRERVKGKKEKERWGHNRQRVGFKMEEIRRSDRIEQVISQTVSSDHLHYFVVRDCCNLY